MTLYRHLLWPLLARLEPERAHGLTLSLLSSAQRVPFGASLVERLAGARGADLGFEWRGLRFAGPAGIAAGWDKDGRAARMAEALGAGFVEVGTVTPLPQPGNPGRRIFRLRSRDALVNRLGFPSLGAARVVENLSRHRPKRAPIGINVGKNAATPLDSAADDYAACLRSLHDVGDYFVVNVSSPNTPGLTSLQSPEALDGLLAALDEARRGALSGRPPKPLLVKLSADLSCLRDRGRRRRLPAPRRRRRHRGQHLARPRAALRRGPRARRRALGTPHLRAGPRRRGTAARRCPAGLPHRRRGRRVRCRRRAAPPKRGRRRGAGLHGPCLPRPRPSE